MDLKKVLGRNVRQLAFKQKITMERLAYENGISKGYMSDIVNGRANASLDILSKLSRALKVRPESLITDTK